MSFVCHLHEHATYLSTGIFIAAKVCKVESHIEYTAMDNVRHCWAHLLQLVIIKRSRACTINYCFGIMHCNASLHDWISIETIFNTYDHQIQLYTEGVACAWLLYVWTACACCSLYPVTVAENYVVVKIKCWHIFWTIGEGEAAAGLIRGIG